MPTTTRPTRNLLGAAVIVATVFAMSFADALVKYLSADLTLWQLYVIRSLLALPLLLSLAVLFPAAGGLRLSALGWTALRSLLLVMMYIAIYAAAPVLELSVIAAALYTGPIFITLFSALLIGERVGARGWLAVGIGFLGVLVILRPTGDAFTPLALVPVSAGLFYALAAILTRSKCAQETPLVLALALNIALLIFGAAASLVLVLFRSLFQGPSLEWPSLAGPASEANGSYRFLFGQWAELNPADWGIVAVLALLIVLIGIGLAKAYQLAAPNVIATFDYSYLIFAAFWGFLIFGHPPDGETLFGMVLIAGGGLLVLLRGQSN